MKLGVLTSVVTMVLSVVVALGVDAGGGMDVALEPETGGGKVVELGVDAGGANDVARIGAV